MGGIRKFVLSEEQAKYLVAKVDVPTDVRRMLIGPGRVELALSCAQRDSLVELIGERLQRKGFDAEWTANEDGQMLESIIDTLTAPRAE